MKRIFILFVMALLGIAIYADSQDIMPFRASTSMNDPVITNVQLVNGKLYVDYRQEPSVYVWPPDNVNNPTVFRYIYAAKGGEIVLESIIDGIYHPSQPEWIEWKEKEKP